MDLKLLAAEGIGDRPEHEAYRQQKAKRASDKEKREYHRPFRYTKPFLKRIIACSLEKVIFKTSYQKITVIRGKDKRNKVDDELVV